MSQLSPRASQGLPPALDPARAATALFYEEQYMRQWWLWAILGLSTVLLAVLPMLPIDEDAGTPTALAVGFSSAGLMLLLMVAMWRIRLRIWVLSDGIHIRYWPLIRHRAIPCEQIAAFNAIEYSPMAYGGWGVRGFGDDRVVNAMGKHGVRLRLDNGNKLTLGSQRSDELARAIETVCNQPPDPALHG